MRSFRRLIAGGLGVTPIEYGLIATLVASAVLTTLSSVSVDLDTALTSIEACLDDPQAC